MNPSSDIPVPSRFRDGSGATSLADTGGFWGERQRVNREVSIPNGLAMLRKHGTWNDFLLAAGKASSRHSSTRSRDSDLFKWLEAVSYELSGPCEDFFQDMAEEAITLLREAQAPDGYLNTWYQHCDPEARWTDLAHGHELYMAGHLIEAAIAHHRATGSDQLLGIALRYADLICDRFGGDVPDAVPGHPEIELALLELYRATGLRKYFATAREFIDRRGYRQLPERGFGSWYYPDHVPVRKARTVQGHVVRALYLASAVADLYLETGEQEHLEALEYQWFDMVSSKLYITGGLGPKAYAEAFGDPYDLPNETAYCETCAGIANIFWSWRMLLANGRAEYADLIERTLYNTVLSGISLSGDKFFYSNPLATREGLERKEWHECACCPPNIMRLVSSLGKYAATATRDGIQIHQYITATISAEVNGKSVEMRMLSGFPWHGNVSLGITKTECSTWNVTFRIPHWSGEPTVKVNGEKHKFKADNRYLTITREWREGDTVDIELPMAPRFIEANPRVETLTGCVAIQRGPLVYCFEQIDQPEGSDIFRTGIDVSSPIHEEWREDLLGGVTILRIQGTRLDSQPTEGSLYNSYRHERNTAIGGESFELTAIPYFAWANRGKTPMAIWLPIAKS